MQSEFTFGHSDKKIQENEIFYMTIRTKKSNKWKLVATSITAMLLNFLTLNQSFAQSGQSTFFLDTLDWGVGRPKILSNKKKKIIKDNQSISLPSWMEARPKSYIDWEKIDTKVYFDLQNWKRETDLKDIHKDWRTNRQELALEETVGRVLHCIGYCQIYRGQGYAMGGFRSRVQEGDEIITLKDSYLYAVLLDGTMVRMSPETSLTIKEINVSPTKIFYHVRLNSGQMIWLSRRSNPPEILGERETDPLFLPLPLFSANGQQSYIEPKEDDLFASLKQPSLTFAQAIRLRDLISQNNQFLKNVRAEAFIVMPNGSVFGSQLSGEFISLLGERAMMKIYTDEFHVAKPRIQYSGPDDGPASEQGPEFQIPSDVDFYFRGYENDAKEVLTKGQWYQIDIKGRTLTPVGEEEQKTLGLGQFFVSNIPTIMIGREMILQQYTAPFLSLPASLPFYGAWQYRMWNAQGKKEDEFQLRFNFLKEYTRREETTGLLVAEKFRERMKDRGDTFNAMEFGRNFYGLAIDQYMAHGEIFDQTGVDREELTSTKNPFLQYVRRKYKP